MKRLMLLCLILTQLSLFGQKADDRVLFTISGKPIKVSEFMYIYSKNNGAKADFTKASVEENLRLYKNFKLKVQYARDLKLDTIPSTKTELAGYRKQLADSYLIDREVTDKLVKEAFDRSKTDSHLAHILKSLNDGATPEDTLKQYLAIMDIRKRLMSGEDFARVAREASDDKSAADNGGDLGYFTAIFPNGYYNIENAVYSSKPGQITLPIRTNLGYHLFKLIDSRPARGEMEVAHILLRKPKELQKGGTDPKAILDSLYMVLQKGGNFEDLAGKFSEDKGSADKAGYIGFFGINRFDKSFEDAAFALTKDGEISKPVETTAGWHLIKRISARPITDYESSKKRLEARIKKDGRYEQSRKALVEKIKKQCGLVENKEAMATLVKGLDETYFNNEFKMPDVKTDAVLYTLDNGTKLTTGQFLDFLKANTRKRMSMKQTNDIASAVDRMYEDNLNTAILKYEEGKLEQKYPEFKSLMREYEEGTLLFAASERMVWKKASEDSLGLKKFFNENLSKKFKWDKRVQAKVYTQRQASDEEMKKAYEMIKANPKADIDKEFNKERKLIVLEARVFEIGKNVDADKMLWKEGELSDYLRDEKGRVAYFLIIEKVLEPGFKTLEEARGYAVADYGDYLEKQWVDSLNAKYQVKVDQKVFDSLLKK